LGVDWTHLAQDMGIRMNMEMTILAP